MKRAQQTAWFLQWTAGARAVSAAREMLTAVVVDAGLHRTQEWASVLSLGCLDGWRTYGDSIEFALDALVRRSPDDRRLRHACQILATALSMMPPHHDRTMP